MGGEESEVWTQSWNLGCDHGGFFGDSRTQGIPDSSRWQLGNRGRTHWRREHSKLRVRITDTLTQKEQLMSKSLIGKEDWSEHNAMIVAVQWEIIITLKTSFLKQLLHRPNGLSFWAFNRKFPGGKNRIIAAVISCLPTTCIQVPVIPGI